MIDTLALLFGGRASSDVIRSGADRARVSGIFDAPESLGAFGIEADDGELILEREILSSGKSRAFANGRPVTAAILREIAPLLGDIHGQHDQQRLFEEATQREILDSFGGYDVAALRKVYTDWKAAEAELAGLEARQQERLRLADLWNFQKKELEAAELENGEDARLEGEKRTLGNVTKLSQLAAESYELLYESPESTLSTLKGALKRTEELVRIDPTLEGSLDAMRQTEISLNEVAHGLRGYLDNLESDPNRLEEVENRLALLDKLKRKYGGSIEEMIAFLDDVRTSLTQSLSADDRAQQLTQQVDALKAEYLESAKAVSASRNVAARKLEKKIAAELRPLAMERANFVVAIHESQPSAHGSDRVEFLISPNLGEEPRPMDRVLSGGELSRLALALKCVTNTGPAHRTLVFDEVDAGIGGAVADAVGRRLKQIAAENQVLCVTHLAQIAGFGDHHYVVDKQEAGGRTVATVEELDRGRRIQELGRMLAGQRVTPEALKHAEQLLDA